jgi:rhodanese-related sulfurtransferase
MSVRRVSPAEAHDLVEREGYVHVDVRTEVEWRAGHARGALNVPYQLTSASGMAPNVEFLPVMLGLFARDQALVLSCKSGARSLKAATLLEANGFTCVVDQRAGLDGVRDAFGKVLELGWARAGLPQDLPQDLTAGAGSYAELRERVAGGPAKTP